MISDGRVKTLYDLFLRIQKIEHKKLKRSYYNNDSYVFGKIIFKKYRVIFKSTCVDIEITYKSKMIRFTASKHINNFKTFLNMMHGIDDKFIDYFEMAMNERLIENV